MRGVVSARALGWLALLLVFVAALMIGVFDSGGARTPEERARNIASTVGCPTCAGQSVADSDATASRGIRSYIDERITEGATDDEIRDELAARFGEDVLLEPSGSGVAALVWVLPVAVLVVALAGVGFAFHRWRRAMSPAPASDADWAMVDAARQDLHAEDGAQVESPRSR
jgi:cytochrome c-type biogenesis protein CcmH/NrfF